jgi:small subunit ribosomal protein S13
MITIGKFTLTDKRTLRETISTIYGINRIKAQKLVVLGGFKPEVKMINLAPAECQFIFAPFLNMLNVDIYIKKRILYKIKQLQKIKNYRGVRLSMGLPAHGQRTKSNSKTPRRMKFNARNINQQNTEAALEINFKKGYRQKDRKPFKLKKVYKKKKFKR